MADAGKKGGRTRAKTKEAPAAIEAGKGVPTLVSQSLKRPDRTSIIGNKNVNRRSTIIEKMLQTRTTFRRRSEILGRSGISGLSQLLELDEFEFPEDHEFFSGGGGDNAAGGTETIRLDVSALDRYNDDIRKLRRMCIDECRNFPVKGEPDEGTSMRIKGVIRSICRSSFYATRKSQELAEGTVLLIVWLLNKKNVSSAFKVHILQSFAEMVWCSDELKYALYRCNGMRILVKLLVRGCMQRSDQARWACYTLAMACVGCREIIDAVQNVPNLDEVVGEVAFPPYWANWPANFGQILQGILYGPNSVIPVEDAYQFL